ncbi:MAG: preprotein translocase subunit YajC [Sphingobacteriales bacterium]|nr:MAG: preprotein translocase subunit YajC [Sphingobacteriales bacterium]
MNAILFQAAPSMTPQLLMMLGMAAVMYFFMIRPQSRRAKEQKKFAETMGTGETVVTTAGIHGRIQKMNEDGTVDVEVARNTIMRMERNAISMEMTSALHKRTGATATTTAASTSTPLPQATPVK